jgi:hypothetical protein
MYPAHLISSMRRFTPQKLTSDIQDVYYGSAANVNMLFDRLGDTWFDTYGSSATIITYPSTSATAIAYSNPIAITSQSQNMAEVGEILGKKRTRSTTGIVGHSSSKRPRAEQPNQRIVGDEQTEIALTVCASHVPDNSLFSLMVDLAATAETAAAVAVSHTVAESRPTNPKCILKSTVARDQ